MWNHYCKTFVRIQSVILAITAAVFLISNRDLHATGLFFLIMQAASVFGARWGIKIRTLMQRAQNELPLKVRN